MKAWERAGNKMGVDARWEHNILVFDGQGNLLPDTQNFMQWDAMMQRPHSITINPYDPDKAVWFVDDHKHVVYKFSHDGKTQLARYGTYGEPGADAPAVKHLHLEGNAWFNLYLIGAGPRDLAGPLSLMHVK